VEKSGKPVICLYEPCVKNVPVRLTLSRRLFTCTLCSQNDVCFRDVSTLDLYSSDVLMSNMNSMSLCDNATCLRQL